MALSLVKTLGKGAGLESAPLWLIALVLVSVVLVTIGGFAVWISRRPNLEPADRAAYWEVFLKALTAVAATFVVLKYLDDRQRTANAELQQQKAEAVERRVRALREERDRVQSVYKELGGVLSGLAAAESLDGEAGATLVHDFDALYFVKLIGVESPEVAGSMVELRPDLLAWRANHTAPTNIPVEAMALKRELDAHVKRLDARIQEVEA